MDFVHTLFEMKQAAFKASAKYETGKLASDNIAFIMVCSTSAFLSATPFSCGVQTFATLC